MSSASIRAGLLGRFSRNRAHAVEAAQPPTILRYVLGNTLALLWGFGVAYGALLGGKHITGLTIRTADFVQYYAVSHLILQGHGGAIYDFARLSGVEAALVYPLSVQHGVLPFLYPPYFALLAAPLAALPYTAAFGLWLVVNCLLLSVAMFAVERYVGLAERGALLFRLIAICSLPVIMTLWLGQVSVLILALLAACFFAARSGRAELAGIALAVAAIKPPYVLPFLVLFLVRREWRTLIAFGITGVCLLLLPIPLLGSSIDRAYLNTLLEVSAWQGHIGAVTYQHVMVDSATYDARSNQSLTGLAYLLFPSPMATVARIALSLGTLLALVQMGRRSQRVDIPFGVAAGAALLISPHVLSHDLALLIVPVAVLLRHRPGLRGRSCWTLVVGYGATIAGYAFAPIFPVQVSVLVMSILFFWLLTTREGDMQQVYEPAVSAGPDTEPHPRRGQSALERGGASRRHALLTGRPTTKSDGVSR